ncbi:MAG: hypothetical protein RBU37_22715, partial [Myxococcota bacterium]|nr:hypothetical protein [Myxococcota bacterium]
MEERPLASALPASRIRSLTGVDLAGVGVWHSTELGGKRARAERGQRIAVAKPELAQDARLMAHEAAHLLQRVLQSAYSKVALRKAVPEASDAVRDTAVVLQLLTPDELNELRDLQAKNSANDLILVQALFCMVGDRFVHKSGNQRAGEPGPSPKEAETSQAPNKAVAEQPTAEEEYWAHTILSD